MPYWISRELFIAHFDQRDFECRKCQDVLPYYLADWFYENDGQLSFELPVVQFVHGKTQFINGRHRTAVLLKSLDCIPLALLMPFEMLPNQFQRITSHPMSMGDSFELPDLKIVSEEELKALQQKP